MGTGLTEAEPGFYVGPAAEGLHYDSARSLHWREAEDGSGWHRHRAAVVVDVVARFPPDGTLFDLGGGNGFVSRALVGSGTPAVLVEPVEEAVRTAYDRGLRPVVCSTVEAAGFPDGSLPAVGLFDVVEHVEDDAGFLRGLRGLLVPGGRLYLTVPKHPRLWSAHDEESGHQRRYTADGLRSVVEQAGFTVEHQTSFFSASAGADGPAPDPPSLEARGHGHGDRPDRWGRGAGRGARPAPGPRAPFPAPSGPTDGHEHPPGGPE